MERIALQMRPTPIGVGPAPILPDTDPLLRTVSEPVRSFSEATNLLAATMVITMAASNGVGLAAVQIGVPLRLIVVRDERQVVIMANPVITRRLRRDEIRHEGCLSVAPTRWKRIARPAKCEVEWDDLDGRRQSGAFSGLLARAIQHECDHLDGVLIHDLPRAA